MTTKNVLNMSDEELANLDPATLVEQSAEEQKPETTETTEEVETTVDAGTETDKPDDDNDQEADKQKQSNDAEGEPTPADNKDESGEGKQPAPQKDKQTDAEKPATVEGNEPDYKAELGRVLSPIKANGREIKVDSVDDAIQLMQMGANYHKKMAALKPNLAVLKMLEQHGLLEQEKLSYLIDLSKKNPDAIKKLVKESGIDPLDIDTKKEDTYKPQIYAVDEQAVELDNVMDDLKGSTHYTRLLSTLGRDWDDKSRQTVADNPDIMRVINSHMETGIFDKIVSTLETDRALGRLAGLSDLEAYRNVGDRLQAAGAFNGLVHQAKATTVVAPVKPVTKPEASEANKDKKRAASSTRASAAVKVAPVNILNMSDEELANLDITKFTTQ